MELMQYFSKNFFSKIFPVKYFQRKTDGIIIDVVSQPLHIYLGNVYPQPIYNPPAKLLPTIGGGYSLYQTKNVIVKLESKPLIICDSQVEIIVKKTWESNEEIIDIVNVLFNLFYNSEYEITNNYVNDDEEEIAYLLTMIDW